VCDAERRNEVAFFPENPDAESEPAQARTFLGGATHQCAAKSWRKSLTVPRRNATILGRSEAYVASGKLIAVYLTSHDSFQRGVPMYWRSSLEYLVVALVALGIPWIIGCDTDVGELTTSIKDAATEGVEKATQTVSESAKEAKETIQDTTATVSEEVGLAGSIDMTLESPIQIGACYVEFVQPTSSRPGVLQLQSYREAASESFPSIFVQAQVSAATVAELVGQTLPAQVFVQTTEDGSPWHTETDLVQITIVSVDGRMVSAEVVDGTLLNANTGDKQPIQGSFRGVLQ